MLSQQQQQKNNNNNNNELENITFVLLEKEVLLLLFICISHGFAHAQYLPAHHHLLLTTQRDHSKDNLSQKKWTRWTQSNNHNKKQKNKNNQQQYNNTAHLNCRCVHVISWSHHNQKWEISNFLGFFRPMYRAPFSIQILHYRRECRTMDSLSACFVWFVAYCEKLSIHLDGGRGRGVFFEFLFLYIKRLGIWAIFVWFFFVFGFIKSPCGCIYVSHNLYINKRMKKREEGVVMYFLLNLICSSGKKG